MQGQIGKVGCKIFQAGTPEMHFHGLKLLNKEGHTIHDEEWCDLGNWKYQEIGDNETMIGFHGQINKGMQIIRLGIVTVQDY